MSSAEPPGVNRQIISVVARLAIGAALLTFLFTRHADLEEVWRRLVQADARLIFMALFVAVCGEIITAAKWQLLVRHIGGRLPIATAVRASFIGMFYNNFFPGSVGGDIARVLIIARYAGGKARAAASAFMQRNTGLAGLFAVGIPAAFLWPRRIDWPGYTDGASIPAWLTDGRTWLICAALGYAAVNALLFSRRAYGRLWKAANFQANHPGHSRIRSGFQMIFSKVQRFHVELHGYRFWLPLPLMISAITQLIDVFLVYTLGQALGLSIPFTVLAVAVPMVTLANLAPITVNGIGLRETLYVALLYSAGVVASDAIALSLLHFAVVTMLAAFGGILHAMKP